MEFQGLNNFIGTKYYVFLHLQRLNGCTLPYNKNTPDSIYEYTETSNPPYNIYLE